MFGKEGIAPFKDRSLKLPSLFYFSTSNTFLQIVVYTGIISSFFIFSGIYVPLALTVSWLCYLAFYLEGYPFLSFQWDALLIETGFIAVFYSLATPPPLLLQIALWVLLFRLLVASGLVKWLSGCLRWRALDALKYHFETQPLPNWGGFFAHQMMKTAGKGAVIGVFFFEVLVPILFFGTAPMRLTGALLSIFFQLLIIATGNYAFFNLLTIALCVTLIDDRYFYHVDAVQPTLFLEWPLNILGAIFIGYSILIFIKQFFSFRFHLWGYKYFRSIGILNNYGLFAVMTPIRYEIILEGSEDGIEWKEYVFKYKPGLMKGQLRQIAPFHPRLDWQMWFAALGNYHSEYWFQLFIARIFQGSKPVLDLLKENPFPETPPNFLRATRYQFNFSTIEEWQKTGDCWKRIQLDEYFSNV